MTDVEQVEDVIALYRAVARDAPSEALDDRILASLHGQRGSRASAAPRYAMAATLAAVAVGISLYVSRPMHDSSINTDAHSSFGLIEGSARAFLLRQTGSESMGPGDSFFVRIENTTEEH